MKTHTHWSYRKLFAATLLVSSSLPLATRVLADGTSAGTSISNTATATYTDPNDTTNTPINATSNTVVVQVTEVAGLTATALTPSNATPNAGDSLYVDFTITNTGNDPTQFFIPGTATLSNAANFSQGTIQVIAVNGTAIAPVNVPAGGATTATLGIGIGGSIPANPGTGTTGTITVRVPITALAAAATGQSTTVALGNTPTANAQNQDRTGSINANDLYTVDNADGTAGETTGAPANGTREAMATSTLITIGARQQAFVSILAAIASYNNNGTINNLVDDTLTYNLAMRVENPATPPTGLVATDLTATQITLDGANTDRVLISDAIPAGTDLSATAPIAPAGWTVVYSNSPTTTNANQANWVTTRPPSGITRVGFIANGPIAKGTTVTGFSFAVTPQAAFTGGQIANIAQVFGQSQLGAVVPGTATQLVYDESGDQTYNDGLDGTNPDPVSGGAAINNGGISNGIANVAADGIDPGTGTNPTAGTTNQGADTGANAGTKPGGGEVTAYTIAAMPLNGPQGQPAAVGPTDNNDDFVNKSIAVPPNVPPTTNLTDAQTPVVTFQNTVQNTNGGTQTISLIPTPPTTATDLPAGTKVTIDPDGAGPATPVAFTYNGTIFTKDNAADPTPSIVVPSGSTATYTVTVDLPAAAQFTGYPVPITAFVDTNGNGTPEAVDPSNLVIDRVYTGYITLQKQARILESNGTPVTGAAGSFTTDQTALSAAVSPGRLIEYQIQYKNISTAQGSGNNNVTLTASNLTITEDGTAGTNTWFTPTKDPVYPTPAIGTGLDSTTGTVTVTASGGDIQVYIDTIATLNPNVTGTLTFRRQIR